MYQLFSPASALHRTIECYWTLHTSQSDPRQVTERVFVDGRADIIFNFGCPYQRRNLGQSGLTETISTTNLDAPRENPVLITQEGEIHLVGIRFKPGGLGKFIPVPLHELRNLVIDPAGVFGSGILDLESRLYDHLADPITQVELLNQFLLSRFVLQPSNEFAFQVARRITESAGRVSVHYLSREFGYSPRHLDRIYQQAFGMAPKFHARIVRFQGALRMLLARPQVELSEIAAACGYYDQPHLSREFMEFAGQSPTQYRTHMAAKARFSPPPILKDVLSSSI